MLIYAHRGDHTSAVENSAAAFESAWRLGYRAVELDVRCLGDGTPVVFHDDNLKRLTGEDVPLAELGYPEFGDLFPEALSLYEFVRNFQSRFALINYEIKDGLTGYRALRPYIRDRRRAIISSFQHEAVDAAIQAGLRGAYLVEDQASLEKGLPGFLNNRLHVSAQLALSLPADLMPWHAYKVHVYTVNATEKAHRLQASGFVRGIFTDNPDLLVLDQRRRAVRAVS